MNHRHIAIAVGLLVFAHRVFSGSTVPKPTLDGNLSDFKAIVLQIQSENLTAIGVNQKDNIANGPSPGYDGFQDEPLQDDGTPQIRFMHSPINVGNAIFIYVPDSDGIVNPPSMDDSWLAIGLNIANGDGDVCVENPNTPGIDCALGCIDDPMTPFDDCAIIKLDTPPDLPLNVMVPFDADGNGNPCILGTGINSRWFPSSPVATFDESQEQINLTFFLCSSDAIPFADPMFSIIYLQRNLLPTEFILDNLNPSLLSLFPPLGSTCNQIRDRGLDGILGPDGLGNDDIEILVDKFDSQVATLFPGEDFFNVTRYRLANLGMTLRSDASGDLSNEDSLRILGATGLFGGDCNNNGIDDVCEGLSCAPGSCCRADASCADSALFDCADGYWTLGGECDPNNCPPVGACCTDNGSCTFGIESDCTRGTWNLSQSCIPNVCPQPGECCRSDGSCTVSLVAACTDGAWAEGGACSPNQCPQPGRCCPGDGTCIFQLQSTCGGTWEEGGSCSANPCPPIPSATAIGCRYLAIEVGMLGTDDPVALRITSDDYACLDLFVSDEGLLTPTPVFQTAAEWGVVRVADHETVPGKSYNVQAINGSFVSGTASVTTWRWGDTNNDEVVNLDDILCELAAFAGNYSPTCTLYSADQIGNFFNPDRVVNLDDILAVLSAFSGAPYPGPNPCP